MKTRRCDTAKHKRRMRKQHENKLENHRFTSARQREETRIRNERMQDRLAMLEAERYRKLHDPRRPYAQRLTNILASRCFQDPAFRILAIQDLMQQMGIPFTPVVQVIDGLPVFTIEDHLGQTICVVESEK